MLREVEDVGLLSIPTAKILQQAYQYLSMRLWIYFVHDASDSL